MDQLSVGDNILKVSNQTDLKEDNWIKAFLPVRTIIVLGSIEEEMQVKNGFQSAIKMFLKN